MSVLVLPCAILNKTKKQVTFSEGFQLSSAADKFFSPAASSFPQLPQAVTVSVYFHSHAQPFPELAATGLTLPRDAVSQQNSSAQRSSTPAADPR